ncbi:MAG: N-acetyltransferase [Candidatus Promineifilaceae bacterium]
MNQKTEPIPHIEQEIVTVRPIQEADFERVRLLLLESTALTPPGFNWNIRRWEGCRWYNPAAAGNPDWNRNSWLWETAAGQPVGLVHPEDQSHAALQVHPDYRWLETEMINWAEQTLAENGRLHFFVYDYDIHRRRILQERGYCKTDESGGCYHIRVGQQSLTTTQLANGYTLRATNPDVGRDAQQIADLLNAAFNRTFHTGLEYQQFTRNATCFVRELDLVAVAEDGRFAAYVGIPYEGTNRRGIFEPVCTHPDHRQKGLAKALMVEGLRRLKARGAVDVIVETGDMIPANALYTSLGFTELYKGCYWCRNKPERRQTNVW